MFIIPWQLKRFTLIFFFIIVLPAFGVWLLIVGIQAFKYRLNFFAVVSSTAVWENRKVYVGLNQIKAFTKMKDDVSLCRIC